MANPTTGYFTKVGAGIDSVKEDLPIGRQGIYNLQGVRLNTTPEKLPAGIYIIDGRKVTIWFIFFCFSCHGRILYVRFVSTYNIHEKSGKVNGYAPFSGSGLTSRGSRERICSVFLANFKPIFYSQVGGFDRSEWWTCSVFASNNLE